MRPHHGSVRATRIGGPLSAEEPDADTLIEPRRIHVYLCADNHRSSVAFHASATPPPLWDCAHCSGPAHHEDLDEFPTDATVPGRRKPGVHANTKTHWDQVRSRRTDAELEALLNEARTNYRATGKAF